VHKIKDIVDVGFVNNKHQMYVDFFENENVRRYIYEADESDVLREIVNRIKRINTV
jgi:hypothetical protein